MTDQETKYISLAPLYAFMNALIADQYASQKVHLETYQHFKKRVKIHVFETLEQYVDSIREAFELITHHGNKFTEKEIEEVQGKLHGIDFETPGFDERLAAAGSIGALAGLDDNFYQKGFEVGKDLMEKQEFVKALSVFTYLQQLDPIIYQFHLGSGVCLFNLKEYNYALQCFVYAFEVAGDMEFMVSLWIIDTLFKLGELDRADEVIAKVIQGTENNDEYKETYELALEKKRKLEKRRFKLANPDEVPTKKKKKKKKE